MPARTPDGTVVIEGFAGVNNVVAEVKLPPQFIGDVRGYSRGLIPGTDARLHRIQGKVLQSPSTALGCVFGIHEVDFLESRMVLVHTSNLWQCFETSELSPLLITPSSINPLSPFIP